jgi:hypothetical protein
MTAPSSTDEGRLPMHPQAHRQRDTIAGMPLCAGADPQPSISANELRQEVMPVLFGREDIAYRSAEVDAAQHCHVGL